MRCSSWRCFGGDAAARAASVGPQAAETGLKLTGDLQEETHNLQEWSNLQLEIRLSEGGIQETIRCVTRNRQLQNGCNTNCNGRDPTTEGIPHTWNGPPQHRPQTPEHTRVSTSPHLLGQVRHLPSYCLFAGWQTCQAPPSLARAKRLQGSVCKLHCDRGRKPLSGHSVDLGTLGSACPG